MKTTDKPKSVFVRIAVTIKRIINILINFKITRP